MAECAHVFQILCSFFFCFLSEDAFCMKILHLCAFLNMKLKIQNLQYFKVGNGSLLYNS